MIATVANVNASPVNRIAEVIAPRTVDAETRERIESDQRERLRIDSRDDLSFEIIAYRMGVELCGYFTIDDVPRWLGNMAYEIWICLPEQEPAERYLRRLAKAKPQAVAWDAALPLMNGFLLETLRSAEPLCDGHDDVADLLSRACALLEVDPNGGDWEAIHNAAVGLLASETEGTAIHCVAEAIMRASARESYSPLWTWEAIENAFGRKPYRDSDGAIRRPVDSLRSLSRQVFRIIREGRRLTEGSTVKAAA